MAYTESDLMRPGCTGYTCNGGFSAKVLLARVGILVGAAALLFVMFYLTFRTIPTVSFTAAAAMVFAAWFFLQFTKIEYAYTVSTGHVEVTKIYGARRHKKIAAFETADIENITRYIENGTYKSDTVLACSEKDPYAYRVVYNTADGRKAIVLSIPDNPKKCFKYYKGAVFTD